MSMDSEFRTVDLGMAAFLVSQGFPLLGMVNNGTRQRIFRFSAAATAAAQGYYQNVPVPARTFFNNVRDLKAMVKET